jgi:thiol:disulfide interchange protein
MDPSGFPITEGVWNKSPNYALENELIRTAALAVSLLLCIPAAAQQQSVDTTTTAPREMFDAQRDADKDIRNAIAEAGRSGRNILLDVGGEWCIWCKRLDGFFASHAGAAELMHRNYVVVKVNYSKDNKNEAVLSKYPKIPGYPHLFVLNGQGNLLHSQDTGLLEEGKGYSEQKIMSFLTEWAPRLGATK